MKRVLYITTVLFALCLVLSGCGKVQHAEKLIEEIGEVTIESGPQIEAAEQAISVLDADQMEKISNLAILDDAKLKYANILEEKEENDKKIERVEKKIQSIKTITEESGNAINAAREAFDRLAPELQSAVSNKDTLSKAEETFEQLAIRTVTDAINQIGAVSLDNEDAIIAAEKVYNKFDESIQQKIENRDVLFAAEETLTLAHICNRKRQNHSLVLLAPFEVFARVEAAVAFLIAVLNKRLCHLQKSIDVAALFPLLTHKARELPHHGKRYILDFRHAYLFFTKAQKEIEVVPITPNRLRGKLPNLNLYQVLFCCCADFHAMLSFRMSQRKERRMSQRAGCISQFRFYLF